MEGACKGVAEVRGVSIGLLPNMKPSKANAYVSIILPTDLGNHQNPKSESICKGSYPEINRNRVIAAASLCLIAIGGGNGTANEINHALQFGQIVFGFMNSHLPKNPDPGEEFRGEFKSCGSIAELLTAVRTYCASLGQPST